MVLDVGNSNGNGTIYITHIISVSMHKELSRRVRCMGGGGGRGSHL